MKPIPGYPDYFINEDGSIIYHNGIQVSIRMNGGGYFTCSIKRKNFLVHRLVAMTYIPNPDSLPVVMHLDNNRINNHYTNLAWGTVDENNKYMWKLGRGVGFKKGLTPWNKGVFGQDNHSSKSVVCMKDGVIQKIYSPIYLVKKDGFHPPTVTKVCKQQLRSHGGFTWHYL